MERLEILGDAVITLCALSYCYDKYPNLKVGDLAKVRSEVVASDTLATISSSLEIQKALIISNQSVGQAFKKSVLEDAFEAIVGAIYLELGFKSSQEFVIKHLKDAIENAAISPGGHDYKTRFQEFCVKHFSCTPTYKTTKQGSDHDPTYIAELYLKDILICTGVASSKKGAHSQAAMKAKAILENQQGLFEEIAFKQKGKSNARTARG